MKTKSQKKGVLRFLFIPLIFCTLTSSCVQNNTLSERIPKIQYIDTCRMDSLHTYAFYRPEHTKACTGMPVIIIISPHAGGNSAIEKFIPAADSFKCMLAASNLIQNNFKDFSSAISELIQDVKSKYPDTVQVFLAGFSGGARMSLDYAYQKQVSGIIACGALADKRQIELVKIPVVGLMGLGDFNFPEVANYVLSPQQKPSNLEVRVTDNIHEWADAADLSLAVGFLRMKTNTQGDASDMLAEGIKGNSAFSCNLSHAELLKLQESLQMEYKMRNSYIPAFTAQSSTWWAQELNTIELKSKETEDKYMRFAWQRLHAFIGIACYTLVNQALQKGDKINAAKILDIYKMAEPDNADMYYYSALLDYQNKEVMLAKEALKNAIEAGFTNMSLIQQNFPEEFWKGL
jgi:predicted esterase